MGIPLSLYRWMVSVHVTRTLKNAQLASQVNDEERTTHGHNTVSAQAYITNHEVSPLDKVMNALANCKAALNGTVDETSNLQINDLKTMVNNIDQRLQ